MNELCKDMNELCKDLQGCAADYHWAVTCTLDDPHFKNHAQAKYLQRKRYAASLADRMLRGVE